MGDLKIKNEENSMILVEGERYRVTTILKLLGFNGDKLEVESEPIEEGLNIEEKLPNGNYRVIISVAYDVEEREPYLAGVDELGVEILRNLVNEVKDPVKIVSYIEEYLNCIDFAKQTLIDIYEGDKINEVDERCKS